MDERRRSATLSLRRLSRRLTLLYLAVSALAVAAALTLVARSDARLRDSRMDATMEIRAQAAAALVYFDGGRLQLSDLSHDAVASGSPQLVVLRGAPPVRQVFASAKPRLSVDTHQLLGVAGEAASDAEIIRGTAEDTRHKPVRLLAAPFYNNAGKAAGAVVVIGDPAPGAAEHAKLVAALALGGGGLLLLAATGGHLLAGRGLRPARVSLEQQDRLLAETARDLRAPAAALRTLADAALADPRVRVEALPRVVRLSAQMGDIVDDLLTRARLSAGVYPLARAPLRLDQLVEATVAGIDPDSRVSVAARPCTVRADAHLVGRAVAHLVENALQHGHLPGQPAQVEVTVHGDGRVSVADRGPGVHPQVAAALRDRAGTPPEPIGLGLSIGLWAARLHRGTLTVGARPGGGAEFTLHIQPEAAGLGHTLWSDAREGPGVGLAPAARPDGGHGGVPSAPRD